MTPPQGFRPVAAQLTVRSDAIGSDRFQAWTGGGAVLGAADRRLRAGHRYVLGLALWAASTTAWASPPREPEPEPEHAASRSTHAAASTTTRIVLFDSPGVSQLALDQTKLLLEAMPGFEVRVMTGKQIRNAGRIDADVIIFTGGSGSRQGKSLGDEGREIVRDFVARGGGYIGVCAGAYLALQGTEEFHKLRLVAAENLTGDSWKRGMAPVEVVKDKTTPPETTNFMMHYANGPIFAQAEIDESVKDKVSPWISLATFVGDVYSTSNGTPEGTMPGHPAIIAARFGKGRVLLFSPNPVLGETSEGANSLQRELMTDAVEWVATPKPIAKGLTFAKVFDGADPVRQAAMGAAKQWPAADASKE